MPLQFQLQILHPSLPANSSPHTVSSSKIKHTCGATNHLPVDAAHCQEQRMARNHVQLQIMCSCVGTPVSAAYSVAVLLHPQH